MIKKMTIAVAAFASEIKAGVMLFNKVQVGIDDGGLAISPADAVCPRSVAVWV